MNRTRIFCLPSRSSTIGLFRQMFYYFKYLKEQKNPKLAIPGFWFIKTFQFYVIRKPKPVSIPLFLPVKSEQNIDIPLRLEVDSIMANMCLYVFICLKLCVRFYLNTLQRYKMLQYFQTFFKLFYKKTSDFLSEAINYLIIRSLDFNFFFA